MGPIGGTGHGDKDTPDPGWVDRSVLEAVSWRLASELVRRHPHTTRIVHTHPGGGQYDCLTITTPDAQGGAIELNRNGTIQIRTRFDGTTHTRWDPVGWDDYLRADPRQFLDDLEHAGGLPVPAHVPAATPMTLTYRVLATIAAIAIKSVEPISIHSAHIDSSDGSGPNRDLDLFTMIPYRLRQPHDGDLLGAPGYRFWIVLRNQTSVLAFEQHEGLAWTLHDEQPVEVMAAYRNAGRHVLGVAADLIARSNP